MVKLSEVWSFLVTVLGSVVEWLREIPIYEGDGVTVYLWEFLVALLILTVVITATVSIVRTSTGSAYTYYERSRRSGGSERSESKDVG